LVIFEIGSCSMPELAWTMIFQFVLSHTLRWQKHATRPSHWLRWGSCELLCPEILPIFASKWLGLQAWATISTFLGILSKYSNTVVQPGPFHIFLNIKFS
jgi:hypothetical protein